MYEIGFINKWDITTIKMIEIIFNPIDYFSFTFIYIKQIEIIQKL
jgi:hypothetical protein